MVCFHWSMSGWDNGECGNYTNIIPLPKYMLFVYQNFCPFSQSLEYFVKFCGHDMSDNGSAGKLINKFITKQQPFWPASTIVSGNYACCQQLNSHKTYENTHLNGTFFHKSRPGGHWASTHDPLDHLSLSQGPYLTFVSTLYISLSM